MRQTAVYVCAVKPVISSSFSSSSYLLHCLPRVDKLAGQSELDSRIAQKQTGVEARLLRAVFYAWLGVAQRYDLHRRQVT